MKLEDINKEVYRYDVMEDSELFLTKPFRQVDEFLEGRAIVTNIGVFTYKMADGEIIRELRPPEEVLDTDSLDSLKMLPMTNNHPKELVDINNIKKFQVGMTGSDVFADSFAVSVPIKLTDINTIQDAKNGKIALSCGYTADLEFTPGVWMGVKYDAIQRNIKYNHVAVVNAARAGDLAKMRLRVDSKDAVLQNRIDLQEDNDADENKQNFKKEDSMAEYKTIKLDNGVDYEADEKVIEAFTTLKKDHSEVLLKLEDSEKSMSTVTAERDTLNDKLDAANKEVQKLKDSQVDEKQILEAVKVRSNLIDSAKSAEVEVSDEMANLDIKKAIVSKIFPKAQLDGKDEIYIDSRFDSAIEIIAERKVQKDQAEENNLENKKKVIGDSEKPSTESKEVSYLSRYDAYKEELKEAYKGGK